MLEGFRKALARAIHPTPAPPTAETKGIDFFGATSTADLVYFNRLGSELLPDLTEETAYAVAVLSYAAVNYRARNVAEARPRVGRRLEDGSIEWVDHELQAVLDDPSLDYDTYEVLWLTVASLDLYGAALLVMDPDRGGRVGALEPFAGREFQELPGDGRIYGAFRLSTATGPRTLSWEEVVFLHHLNPTHRYDRTSPTLTALRWLNLGSEVQEAVKRMMSNSMFPSVVISPHQDWDPDRETYNEFKRTVEAFHTGSAQAGKPFVALGGSKVQRVAFTLEDLLPAELLHRIESTVSMAYGVPPVILGAQVGLENSPWSQMEEARKMTLEDTIGPLWRWLSRVLTRQLLRPIDSRPDLVVEFDLSGIAALKDDESKRIEDAERAIVWTLDERRTHTGQPQVGGEAGAWIEAVSPSATTPEEEEAELEEASERPVLATKAHELAWWRFDLLTKAQEGEWESFGVRQLGADRDAYLKRLESRDFGAEWAAALEAVAGVDTDKAEPRDIVPAVLAVLREGVDRVSEWSKAAAGMITRTARRAVKDVAVDVGVSFDVLVEGLEDYVDREALRLAKEIDATTQRRLATVLRESLAEGEGVPELAKRLERSSGFTRTRARLIARTETTSHTTGAARSSLSSYQADRIGTAVVEKSWLSARDGNVRPAHQELDKGGAEEGWIPIDEPYANGLQSPGEPNCRCGERYRIREAS